MRYSSAQKRDLSHMPSTSHDNPLPERDAWGDVLSGSADRGLSLMLERHNRKRTASRIMELGIAYLWLKRYAEAWEHFQQAIKTHPQSIEGFYAMGGVAKWCLGKAEVSVQQWQLGLRAHYAWSVVSSSTLLLFAASVLRPEVLSREQAEASLTKKINSKAMYANLWPKPIGLFLLGSIDEQALRTQCGGINPIDTMTKNWEVGFYGDVRDFGRGDMALKEFRMRMRRAAEAASPERAERRAFLALVWHPEFFIARYEAL